jgi:hypothetical protein
MQAFSRAIVPVVPDVVEELNDISEGYINVANVKKSFAAMATEMNLPREQN